MALVQSGLTLSSPYHIETNELVSVDWFLYDKNLCHERVKEVGSDPKKCIQSQQQRKIDKRVYSGISPNAATNDVIVVCLSFDFGPCFCNLVLLSCCCI